ncbi:MAG: signal recognition particle-docking protein FtsY [Rickettsiales bacterium]
MYKLIKLLFSRSNKKKISAESLFAKDLKKIFKKNLDQDFLLNLEALLLKADIGPKYTEQLINSLNKLQDNSDISAEKIKLYLKSEIKKMLKNAHASVKIQHKPYVILASGVNGSGKTTSLGKLAYKFAQENKKVVIVAADTFRAAAADQIGNWADQAGVKLFRAEKEGADPASLAYKALEYAQKENYDIVLIDTAGRLQNNQNFMNQLAKIVRVIKKLDEQAPHLSLLVLDSTTGQNSLKQMEVFKAASLINGLIMTKLDGTAKGGCLVALVQEYNVPVYFMGIGEGLDDLVEFNVDKYLEQLF